MATIAERRSLRFDKSSVVAAILERHHSIVPGNRKPLVRQVEITDGQDGVGVRVSFDSQIGAASDTLTLAGNQLAATLVRFCISRHTPLPRRARKSLRTDGDAIFLELEYDWSCMANSARGSA